ncbi:MAG: hypothetical protein N2A99_03080, partial [Carnobacterium alterfunditum]
KQCSENRTTWKRRTLHNGRNQHERLILKEPKLLINLFKDEIPKKTNVLWGFFYLSSTLIVQWVNKNQFKNRLSLSGSLKADLRFKA